MASKKLKEHLVKLPDGILISNFAKKKKNLNRKNTKFSTEYAK